MFSNLSRRRILLLVVITCLLLITLDHQGLQHQFAALDQAILECQQVLDRRAAVVEHAHGKHGVETFHVRRQVFERERQVPGVGSRQVTLYRLELAEKQPVGIDANHAVSTGAEHAPHVVAVATTHIEEAFAFEVQVRRDPRPFPVRAPFGVHMHPEQIERPLAPRAQAHQRGMHLRAGRVIAIGVEGQTVKQVDFTG